VSAVPGMPYQSERRLLGNMYKVCIYQGSITESYMVNICIVAKFRNGEKTMRQLLHACSYIKTSFTKIYFIILTNEQTQPFQ